MTPQEKALARRKARGLGLIGCGIGALVFAYQYGTSPPKEGTIPLWAPLIFVAVGLGLMLIGGLLARSASKASKETVSK